MKINKKDTIKTAELKATIEITQNESDYFKELYENSERIIKLHEQDSKFQDEVIKEQECLIDDLKAKLHLSNIMLKGQALALAGAYGIGGEE